MTPGADICSMAQDLARTEGFVCFPCADSKRPTLKDWPHRASAEPAEIARLWRYHPGPLIAVVTGSASNVDVLDIDKKLSAREWWATHRAKLPETRVHRSRSGGLHLLFRHAPGLRNSAGKIAHGIDIRADGGYIVYWPAIGLPVLCDAPPAPWPRWLRDALKPAPPPRRRVVIPDNLQLRRILAAVADAPEGRRNGLTFWAACRLSEMTASGMLSENDALALVVDAATASGLPYREALATATSGIRRS